MAKKVQKKKTAAAKPAVAPQPKDFLDMVAPAAVKFNTDHAIVGGVYRSFMALRGYPATTESLALLRHLGEKSGVSLTVYTRKVTAAEEKQIIQNASSKNQMVLSSSNDLRQNVTAQANIKDMTEMVASMDRQKEPLLHCAVLIGLTAREPESLRVLRDQVTAELIRAKLSADPLLLRQREGFMASNPAGFNAFGAQYERVLPASSVANLYPFNYSGKTDPQGFYVGRDRYGSNIIVDLDRRAEEDRKSTRLNSSHCRISRMPSSA